MALAEGYRWLRVDELTISRDAIRVTPSRPVFGFDEDEPDPFLDEMHVQHTTSALLVFTLDNEATGKNSLSAKYLANIEINSD